MADADRLVAALNYLEAQPAFGDPAVARRYAGGLAKEWRMERDAGDPAATAVRNFLIGETPGEMAFNAAMGPLRVPARVVGLGLSGLLASDEAEGAGSGLAKTVRQALADALKERIKPLFSRGAGYNAPARSPRAFIDDYPIGARADEAGNLTHDIDGRLLVADPRRIAGR